MSHTMQVTKRQFSTLEDLFNYYNEQLFNNELPACLVNMSRHKGAHGFFAPQRWKDKKDESFIHEISLNPDTMNRNDSAWHSTLVHEMVHLWQQELGTPPRRCYHDKQFAAKMEAVGLMPSTTGQPGGKKTGQSMTHYIIEGGPFDTAFKAISAEQLENLKTPIKPARPAISLDGLVALVKGLGGEGNEGEGNDEPQPKPASGMKIKYSCPKCKCNVWGKPNLHINCGDCDEAYAAA